MSSSPIMPGDGAPRVPRAPRAPRVRRSGFLGGLGRLLRRVLLLAVLLVLGLLSPVAYVELLCRPGPMAGAAAAPILPPEHRRPESNTLLTYPEWHIVHAYEDTRP